MTFPISGSGVTISHPCATPNKETIKAAIDAKDGSKIIQFFMDSSSYTEWDYIAHTCFQKDYIPIKDNRTIIEWATDKPYSRRLSTLLKRCSPDLQTAICDLLFTKEDFQPYFHLVRDAVSKTVPMTFVSRKLAPYGQTLSDEEVIETLKQWPAVLKEWLDAWIAELETGNGKHLELASRKLDPYLHSGNAEGLQQTVAEWPVALNPWLKGWLAYRDPVTGNNRLHTIISKAQFSPEIRRQLATALISFSKRFDVNLMIQNTKGDSPAHLAVASGDIEMLHLFHEVYDGGEIKAFFYMPSKNFDTLPFLSAVSERDDIKEAIASLKAKMPE